MKLINKKTRWFLIMMTFFAALSSQAQLVEEFQYPYDSIKLHLTMENTEQAGLDQDWQPVLIHGTWSTVESITQAVRRHFEQIGRRPAFIPDWDGENLDESRVKAASDILQRITTLFDRSLNLLFYGHSHGGNIAILVINELVSKYGYNPKKIRLITLNTPVRNDYQLGSKFLKHINFYNPYDIIQVKGGANLLKCVFSDCSQRIFKSARNFSYLDARAREYYEEAKDPVTRNPILRMIANYTDCSNRHCGNADWNFNVWFPIAKNYLKYLEMASN